MSAKTPTKTPSKSSGSAKSSPARTPTASASASPSASRASTLTPVKQVQQPKEFQWPVSFARANAASLSAEVDPRGFVHPADFVRLRIRVGDAVIVIVPPPEGAAEGAAEGAHEAQRDVVALWPSASVPVGQLALPGYVCNGTSTTATLTIERVGEDHGISPIRSLSLRPVAATDHAVRRVAELVNQQALHWTQLNAHLATSRRLLCLHGGVHVVLNGRPRRFIVTGMELEGTGGPIGLFVEETTRLQVTADTATAAAAAAPPTTDKPAAFSTSFADIGGLKQQINSIKELLVPFVQRSDVYQRFKLRPPRGILLYGPPGTGKTMLARCVAGELGVAFYSLSAVEAVSKYYGETEAKIKEIFDKAKATAPAIVFIDEIDVLAPKRDAVQSDLEKRVVATLLTIMDGANSSPSAADFVVLAATNRPGALDPALRRPGRFDTELEIGIPTSQDRSDILQKLLSKGKSPSPLSPRQVQDVADACHGYVGADLKALVNEAALLSIRRRHKTQQDADEQQQQHVAISFEDLQGALVHVRPSAMRQILIEVPTVTWADIGGQEEVKARLREAVEWPLKHPEAFSRLGIRPPKGLLLYGPPGNSKTMMAKALANEAKLNFLAVKGPELFSKWVGESERAVRELFRKARQVAPSIVFLDEVDAIASQRGQQGGGDSSSSVGDRVLSQMLTELDGIEPLVNVVVLAATNRPDILDRALLRPGRIDRLLFIGLPDPDARRAILARHLAKTPNDLTPDQVDAMATGQLEGYSGAEVAAVCREASMAALEEDINTVVGVSLRHFTAALNRVKPRTSQQMLDFYANFQKKSGLSSL